ncbi:MAG: PAS domain S-box protein, partial [Oxalobacteraceae bacterium]
MLHPFPNSGGECGAVLRSLDWSVHPLGEPQTWPEPLKAAIRIVLTSGFPMMVHWGPELFTFYNDAYAPSLGRKHPGHLGQPAYEWWSEMWDQLTTIFDRVLAGETVTVEDARYTPDRDGGPQEAYFNHSHSPLWDTDGKIAGVFLVVTETTRRVVAERERETEDRRSRQIMDSATDFAIIATDLEGRITRWTKGAEAVLGWNEEEMLGQSIEALFTPEDRDDNLLQTEMTHALASGFSAHEGWRMRRDGSRFWASGQMTPLRNQAGGITGFVKILRDRTGERSAAQDLEASQEQLRLAQSAGGIGIFALDIA